MDTTYGRLTVFVGSEALAVMVEWQKAYNSNYETVNEINNMLSDSLLTVSNRGARQETSREHFYQLELGPRPISSSTHEKNASKTRQFVIT